jgi:hypothetical protein
MPKSKYEKIQALLQGDVKLSDGEIARQSGCATSTVCRHRRRMEGAVTEAA